MLITRSDDGYFGLRRSHSGGFDKAVSSLCDKVSEEHGLTEDGKTVVPTFCVNESEAYSRRLSILQFPLRLEAAAL